jgi:outer membrane lipoprotein-sorting protein
VDKERFVTMRVQFFALSGMLLKEMNVLEVKRIKDRYFPVRIKMEDKQRRNSHTIFEMKNIEINVSIDKSVFSKRYLER